MKTFFSSGDIGDIIYSLPILNKIGGGEYVLGNRPGTKTITYFDVLRPLMLEQSYVSDFRMERTGESFDFNTSTFRPPKYLCTLTQLMAEHVNQHPCDTTTPWITIPEAPSNGRVVIHRSSRYSNDRMPWQKIVSFYGPLLLFIGLKAEHSAFCSNYGNVEFHQIRDYVDMAQKIRGSFLFIGNQSSPFALAEGMKHPRIQETCEWLPDCIFGGQNVQYIYTGYGTFPHPTKDPLVIAPEEKRLRDRMGGCPGGYRYTVGGVDVTAANFSSLVARVKKVDPNVTEDMIDARLAKGLNPPHVTGVDGNFVRVLRRFQEVGYNEDEAASRFASMRV